MKNASLFMAKNIALLHHLLCNLSILLFVNLTNFANFFFYFSSFGAGLSRITYSTSCNFEFKSHLIDFSTGGTMELLYRESAEYKLYRKRAIELAAKFPQCEFVMF